jgi:hypothetical protein
LELKDTDQKAKKTKATWFGAWINHPPFLDFLACEAVA